MTEFKRVPIERRNYKMAILLMKKKRETKIRRQLKEKTKKYLELGLDEQIVWNLKERSKKVGYDPETDTNWCHLPMEMRAKCIEEMDFQTRIRLGSTSIIEKLLVEDSKKYHFDVVEITNDDFEFTVKVKNYANSLNCKYITVKGSPSRETNLRVVLRLLKTCDIDEFYYNCYSEVSKTVVTDLAECVPFGFERLETHCRDWETMKFFLDNSPNLEVIRSDSLLTFQEAADHPMVASVKEFRAELLESPILAWKLIRKWIEMDAGIGKSIQFVTDEISVDKCFVEEFKERLIQKTENVVRIRMNNDTKQIILKTVGIDRYDEVYLSCKVVPIDLPESEYGNGDEWITELLRDVQETEESFDDKSVIFGCAAVPNSSYRRMEIYGTWTSDSY